MNKLEPYYQLPALEAGTDEAGRGCLAGPVTAAAILLPEGFQNPILNDSKQLTEIKRERLRPILQAEALTYSVSHVFPEEIDEINILNASFLAMHKALENLATPPEFILVDGNRFKPFKTIPHQCIIKGDGKYMSIAAASVLAKTYRDEIETALNQATGCGAETRLEQVMQARAQDLQSALRTQSRAEAEALAARML